ncbi:MAG: hypothetical protein ACYSWZ_00250 [Planctomycetota bacterium]
MAREYVSYTGEWFYDVAARFVREIGRSIAFGVIMFLSLVFLIGAPLLTCYGIENVVNVDSFDALSFNDMLRYNDMLSSYETVPIIVFFFVGLPLCILCWWAALKVAEDRHWEKPDPTIWDNQKARWIEHTVRCVRYLESQGKTTDTSLVFSDDIYAATHKLIDNTDETTVRLLLSVLLASTTARMSSPCRQLESKTL